MSPLAAIARNSPPAAKHHYISWEVAVGTQTRLRMSLPAITGQITVRPAAHPREGWDDAFRAMAANHDEVVEADALPATRFDEREWEW